MLLGREPLFDCCHMRFWNDSVDTLDVIGVQFNEPTAFRYRAFP